MARFTPYRVVTLPTGEGIDVFGVYYLLSSENPNGFETYIRNKANTSWVTLSIRDVVDMKARLVRLETDSDGGDTGGTAIQETDPNVPDYIKNLSEEQVQFIIDLQANGIPQGGDGGDVINTTINNTNVTVESPVDEWEAGTYQPNDRVIHDGIPYAARTTTTAEPSLDSTDWVKVHLTPKYAKESGQVIDLADALIGYALNSSTGGVAEHPDVFVTPFLPLDETIKYSFTGAYIETVYFYDENKNFIEKSTGRIYYGITKTNPNYAFFRKHYGIESTLGVYQPLWLATYPEPSGWIVQEENNVKKLIEDGIVDKVASRNLYDFSTMTDMVAEKSLPIPVEPNANYSKKPDMPVELFDSSDNLIRLDTTGDSFRTNANTAYVKIKYGSNFKLEKAYLAYINKGGTTAKLEQKMPFLVRCDEYFKPIIEMNWLNLGDSICDVTHANGTTNKRNYPYLVQEQLNFRGFTNVAHSGRSLTNFAFEDAYFSMSNFDELVSIGLGTNDWLYNIPLGTVEDIDVIVSYNTPDDLPETGEAGKIYIQKYPWSVFKWTSDGYVRLTTSSNFTQSMYILVQRILSHNNEATIAWVTPSYSTDSANNHETYKMNALGKHVGDYAEQQLIFTDYIKHLALDMRKIIDPTIKHQRLTFTEDGLHMNELAHRQKALPYVREFLKQSIC